jgi:hypothetical protein
MTHSSSSLLLLLLLLLLLWLPFPSLLSRSVVEPLSPLPPLLQEGTAEKAGKATMRVAPHIEQLGRF